MFALPVLSGCLKMKVCVELGAPAIVDMLTFETITTNIRCAPKKTSF